MARKLATFRVGGYVSDPDGTPLHKLTQEVSDFIAKVPGRQLVSLQVSTYYEPGNRPENMTAVTEGLLTFDE